MTTETPSNRGVGRPRDAAKRAAILAAARSQFFRYGAAGVTIDAIATEAGVSRMTVYGHFGDKETLFGEVVAAQAAAVGRALAGLSLSAGADAEWTRESFVAALVAFGEDLVTFLVQPDTRSFNRLMELSARDHPQLVRVWLDSGPTKVFRELAEGLARAHVAGFIAAPDPSKAARTLTSLFRGIETLSSGAGLTPPPTASEISSHVHECVAVFLRGYEPR